MSLYHSILVAINPTYPNSRKLLVKASLIAQANQSDLHLIHIEPGVGNLSFIDIELELDEAHHDANKTRILKLVELSKDLPYPVKSFHIGDGDVPKHIENKAEELNSDLVIMGHHHHWGAIFDKTESKLSDKLDCDLLVIKI
ncbi:universal stress protein [Vibrio sp. SS-MA-C1-2]|uniref:universal stress protein n=1 Tax=Vibrio sp. SS-MA-C1-2 TaxID=2908646 RepID=UPI001F3555A1|nr:universal stress protein [Vibrio sp. SS-MA-C1-2]UJF16868.1 universal stress protein [Vibrio sp. SS-MA-C1-2]